MTFHKVPGANGEEESSLVCDKYPVPAAEVTEVLQKGAGKESFDSGAMYRFKAYASDQIETLPWPEELPIYNPAFWGEKPPATGGADGGASMASQTNKLIEAMAGFVVPPGPALSPSMTPIGFYPDLAVGLG
ncbi:hypothetical protein ACSFA3_05115 [Variovorax sp. RHLX14]|uniref:hypothetical protein n=1 Tax=Variovorax sp. RHLX14 TaxID=1259731 RepID=UPI003F46FFD9